ncbi:MAG: hypothetical protein U9Q66_02225, partial [Patescibacteria group bacterium]|nr:hypothetical protein [Patescibacteria group bacterium]
DKLISKLYKYNTSKELESIKREIFTEFKNIFDNIFKNNINTKIILIDMQLSNEYYKLIYNLQKKYNSDIKVII